MGLEAELVYREQPISRLRFSKLWSPVWGIVGWTPSLCVCHFRSNEE